MLNKPSPFKAGERLGFKGRFLAQSNLVEMGGAEHIVCDIEQGKSEQMMEYIKKLRACIRWLQASEAALSLEKEQTHNQLLDERKSHTTTG